VEALREQLGEVFSKHGLVAAWLFGSRARQTAGPLSDFDVAVLPGPVTAAGDRLTLRLDLLGELGRIFETDRVDVVLADEAPPLLGHRILRDGELLYCSDTVGRIRFEVRTLREYFDTRPLDEEYFQHMELRHSGARPVG
jgi:predicted nucleotidyltransferase